MVRGDCSFNIFVKLLIVIVSHGWNLIACSAFRKSVFLYKSKIDTVIYSSLLFLCSWLSNDVCHKCTTLSTGDTQTLFGTSWSNNALASMRCYDMVASLDLFATKHMEHLLRLSVLQRLRLKICTETVSF